jgi:hypothetical protein
MKHIAFFILITILLIQCKPKSEKTQKTNEVTPLVENMIKRLDSISAEELENIISIPIRSKFNEKYSGYYSFENDSQGEKVLSGYFEFFYSDSSMFYDPTTKEYDSTWISISKIKYCGTFIDGTKNGTFKEELLFDDGVDIYSKWTVSLKFENDSCTKGTFTGALGHIMPISTYIFEKVDSYTFQSVVDKANEQWIKEFNKKE